MACGIRAKICDRYKRVSERLQANPWADWDRRRNLHAQEESTENSYWDETREVREIPAGEGRQASSRWGQSAVGGGTARIALAANERDVVLRTHDAYTSHLQSACTYHVLGCKNVNADQLPHTWRWPRRGQRNPTASSVARRAHRACHRLRIHVHDMYMYRRILTRDAFDTMYKYAYIMTHSTHRTHKLIQSSRTKVCIKMRGMRRNLVGSCPLGAGGSAHLGGRSWGSPS